MSGTTTAPRRCSSGMASRGSGEGSEPRSTLEPHGSRVSGSYDHESRDRAIPPLITRSPRSISPDPSLPSHAKTLERSRPSAPAQGTEGGTERSDDTASESVHVSKLMEDTVAQSPRPDLRSAATGEPQAAPGAAGVPTPRPNASPSSAASAQGETERTRALGAVTSIAKAETERHAAEVPAVNASAELADDEGLVNLARSLWNDVTFKAARRYVGRLLALGDPPATGAEVARYLQWSAKTRRVQSARFPIAVACMAEEFEDWLKRYRRMRALPGGAGGATSSAVTPPPLPESSALTSRDLEARARAFCDSLGGRAGPASTSASEEVASDSSAPSSKVLEARARALCDLLGRKSGPPTTVKSEAPEKANTPAGNALARDAARHDGREVPS